MERREFIKLTAFAALALFAVVRTAAAVMPERVVFALRLGKYPGPLKPLNEKSVANMGGWAG